MICGRVLGFEIGVHDHYLEELAALFQKRGYRIITEGGIPKYRKKEWGKPDIFVMKELKVEKVVEISVSDLKEGTGQNTLESKCRKIKEYYNPPEIIVFEPAEFTSAFYAAKIETNGRFENYDDYDAYLGEKWRGEGMIVTFWNESKLEEISKQETNKGVKP